MLPWILIGVVSVLLYLISTTFKPKNYPPGPRWYPFFGCTNLLNRRTVKYGSQWKAISEMAKEYSTNVLGLKMGSGNVVVVFGEKNIHQVSNDKNVDARPDNFFVRLRTFGKRNGITFVEGPLWREHRQFTFKNMRSEGYGRPLMHEEIKETLQNLLNFIDDSNEFPINIIMKVSMDVTNISWKYVAGEHIKELQLRKLVELMSVRSKAFNIAGGSLDHWPWLRFIAPQWTGYAFIRKLNKELSDLIDESINKHKNKLVKRSDFIYSFLDKIYQRKETYVEDQLKAICLDILNGATLNAGNTFGFLILAMVRNRAMQEKVYQEIITILGDEEPSWMDLGRLVYTTAFLCEVQRYYTTTPFSGPRRVLTDVTVDGYTIPTGTTILVSLGDLHFDPELWDEPNIFNPERFITANGELKTSTHLYPFGLGRRRCPGETLARAYIITAFVAIVKKYRIECSNGVLPSDEPIIGIFAEPRPFETRFVKRN